jgi:hypothetical protein
MSVNWFAGRNYRRLELPRPLPAGYVRLPDVDIGVLDADGSAKVAEIADAASAMAIKLKAAPPPTPIGDLESMLIRGFKMQVGSAETALLRDWSLHGWAVGSLEETRKVARHGRIERHYAMALTLIRGRRLMGETDRPRYVDMFADALYLGLYCSYYLRREPEVTPEMIDLWWHQEPEAAEPPSPQHLS